MKKAVKETELYSSIVKDKILEINGNNHNSNEANKSQEKNILSAGSMSVEFVDLEKVKINREAVNRINGDIARRYQVFPFEFKNGMLCVAMENPDDLFLIDEIKVFTQMEIKPYYADKRIIVKAIDYFYENSKKTDLSSSMNNNMPPRGTNLIPDMGNSNYYSNTDVGNNMNYEGSNSPVMDRNVSGWDKEPGNYNVDINKSLDDNLYGNNSAPYDERDARTKHSLTNKIKSYLYDSESENIDVNEIKYKNENIPNANNMTGARNQVPPRQGAFGETTKEFVNNRSSNSYDYGRNSYNPDLNNVGGQYNPNAMQGGSSEDVVDSFIRNVVRNSLREENVKNIDVDPIKRVIKVTLEIKF